MYFLDSNTCIYFLNGTFPSIKTKLLSTPPAEIKIPAIVKAELVLGADKSIRREKTIEILEAFLEPFETVSFIDQMCYTYADIRCKTEMGGNLVGPNDLLIASIVKFHEGILITHNVKEFSRIETLQIEDWVVK
jgi:tRNA(fMet)-specific endonuclease VapC